MKYEWLFVLAISCPAIAQTSSAAPTPPATKTHAELKAMLDDAYARNSISAIPSPFHLLATFQTFTQDGQPAGDGSIEQFFASNSRKKTIIRFRDQGMTDYLNEGKHQYVDDGIDATIMSYRANEFIFDSLVPPTGTDRKDLEYKPKQLGATAMDCALFQFSVIPAAMQQRFPLPPKEIFCVAPDTHDLLLKQTENLSIRYRDFAPYAQMSVPRTISVSEGATARIRIHVEKLEGYTPDDAALTPPADASLADPGANWLSLHPEEDTPLHTVPLVYPPDMRTAKIGGPVQLMILISKSGKVKDIEPIYGPSPSIIAAAEDAVHQWIFAPIIRSGKPVESITDKFLYFDPRSR